MAEQNPGKGKNFRSKSRGSKGRRPRRGPRRPSDSTQAAKSGATPQGASTAGSASAGGSTSGSAGGSKGQNRNRRPKSLTPARILQKYDNLMEQHIVARRKFFEMHGRAQGKQLDKIEANFKKSLDSLRRFEDGLKDWQLEVLKEKIDAYPEDRQYSSAHELSPKGEEVSFSGEFEDPHLLPTQIEADFSGDTEESIGTMEDYKNYKGL